MGGAIVGDSMSGHRYVPAGGWAPRFDPGVDISAALTEQADSDG